MKLLVLAGLGLAVAVVAAGQGAFTWLPVMNRIVGSRPLLLADAILILAIGALSLALLEIEKHLLRDRFGGA